MTSIRDIQRRLVGLGFAPGPVDGIVGPKTLSAMNAALDMVAKPSSPYIFTPSGAGQTATVEEKSKSGPSSDIAAIVAFHPKAFRTINEVIVHCAATPEGKEYSVDTIREWHKQRGFSDIGYHWVVHLDGKVEPGRPEGKTGAHVSGHNTGTLGVVYIGGVKADGKTAKDTRTPEQKAALLNLVKALIAKYPTIKKVTGHNQYAAKACPSFDVRTDPLGKLI